MEIENSSKEAVNETTATRQQRRKKKKSKTGLIIGILIVLLIILGFFGFIVFGEDKPVEKEGVLNELTGEYVSELPYERPMTIAFGNDPNAALPQYGIEEADVTYEFPVEGYLTKLAPMYYSKLPTKSMSLRSIRPCIIDMGRLHNAMVVGYGVSPQAAKLFNSGVVDFIDPFPQVNRVGIDSKYFFRDSAKRAPHNVYTNPQELYKAFKERGETKPTGKISAFEFLDEWDIVTEGQQLPEKTWIQNLRDKIKGENQVEDLYDISKNKDVKTINVFYTAEKLQYKYNADDKLYYRWENGNKFIDGASGNQITCSNLIVMYADIKMYDSKRLNIDMFGGGKAALFTQGKLIEGTWETTAKDKPPVFKDKNGVVFKMTPGKTWIQVVQSKGSNTGASW